MKETFLAAGIILLVLVATSIQSFAQEVCVCIDKKGNMKFSESGQCNPRLSLRCWNAGGTDGLNCWDLNADGDCDLPDEDINGDEECDVSDCQGPPGAGVQVYDSSDPPQYLGRLLGTTEATVEIFIERINKMAFVYVGPKRESIGGIDSHSFKFETDDCTGPIYVHDFQVIRYNFIDGKYYFGTVPQIVNEKSYTSHSSVCYQRDTEDLHMYLAAEILEKDIPFTLPVVLPLIYEYQSE
jgi:hypothetical protein